MASLYDNAPLLPLVCSLALGVVFGQWLQPSVGLCGAAGLVLCLLSLVLRSDGSVLCLTVAALFLGMLRGSGARPTPPPVEGRAVWAVRIESAGLGESSSAATLVRAWHPGPHRAAPDPHWTGRVPARVHGLVGEAGRSPRRGDLWLFRGRLLPPNERRQEPMVLAEGVGTSHLLEAGDRPFRRSVDAALHRVRGRVRHGLARAAPPSSYPLFAGLLLGERKDIPSPTREAFARTGTAHLIAISGLHVGLFAWVLGRVAARVSRGLLWWLARDRAVAGFGRCAAPTVSALAATGYVLLAGAPMSARRALVMVLALLLAQVLDRRVSAWNVLAAAVGGVLLLDPAATGDLGFQLSVVSVAGLIASASSPASTPSGLRRAGRVLGSSLRASAATWIATAPLCALVWGRLPVAGLWVNVVAIPLLGLGTVPLVLCGGLAAALHPPAGAPLLHLAALPARWGLDFVAWAAAPQRAPQLLWSPSESVVVAVYVLGLCLLALLKKPVEVP